MKHRFKKYAKYTLIGLGGFMALGIIGSVFESWEYVPGYTPESFLQDVERAEELNETNHLPAEVYSTDIAYSYSKGGRSSRSSFSRPTLCSKGTLTQNGSSRSSIRCNKSFIKNYELPSIENGVFERAIESIESEGWQQSDSSKDFLRNFEIMTTSGVGTLHFKNDRLFLRLSSDNNQTCINDSLNLNRYFCDETKSGVAAFVSVTISADYSDS